jgi:hypothetical protein
MKQSEHGFFIGRLFLLFLSLVILLLLPFDYTRPAVLDSFVVVRFAARACVLSSSDGMMASIVPWFCVITG